MDNKGKIKVNLSTVIFMFIIFILIVVIFGMWYYYNVIKDNNLDNNKSDSVEASNIAKNEDSSFNNIASENSNENNSHEDLLNIKLGSYVVKPDKNILGDISDISGEENIKFSENNKFSAYIGFGNGFSGTYNISEQNIINCNITTFVGEYGPDQKVTGSLTFKINDASTIEVVDASESIKIQISNLTDNGWTLSDEYKDLSLIPFVKGIKFIISD